MIPDNYLLPGALAILGAVVAYRLWSGRPGLRQAVAQAVPAPAAAPPAGVTPAAKLKDAFDTIEETGRELGAMKLAQELGEKEAAAFRERIVGTFSPAAPPKDRPAPPA